MPASFAADSNDATAYPAETLPTAEGGQLSLTEARGDRATVLVFTSVDCPISRGYTPVLNRLVKDYAERGLRVIGLNSNVGQSLKQMDAHHREYDLAFPLAKDPAAGIARRLGVKICPEVCLFDADGRLRYQGRIDDRYVRRGASAVEAERADLVEALEELLAGKPVSVAKTEAIGCPVDFPRDRAAAEEKTYEVDFSRHIARILQDNCQACHRPGGIGPFALTNYQQAASWAEDLRIFTADRTMPPWKAVEGYGEFVDPRRLSQRDIDLIDKWVELGCPEGDPKLLPPPRVFRDGWQLGEPDAVLVPAEEYTVSAEGSDEYRCFVIPTDFDADRFVSTIEVLPGNASVVHHVLVFLDQHGAARKLAEEDALPGYATSGGFPGFVPDGHLGGWAPGNHPEHLPEGVARILPKGADVVVQVHYHKTGKQETDRTRIGLHFSKQEVRRAVYSVAVMPPDGPLGGMRIPAGAENHEVKTSLVMPVDMVGMEITPHMHLLGTDMKVTATFPDGTVRPLIWVKNWDFNWQESYQFKELIDLPRGTRLDLVAHFDNSKHNPVNPNRPPKLVTWGEETTDEMCIAFLQVTPKKLAASQDQVRNPTPAERLQFVLEARRLSGDNTPLVDNPWLRALLKQVTGGADQEQPAKENRSRP